MKLKSLLKKIGYDMHVVVVSENGLTLEGETLVLWNSCLEHGLLNMQVSMILAHTGKDDAIIEVYIRKQEDDKHPFPEIINVDENGNGRTVRTHGG